MIKTGRGLADFALATLGDRYMYGVNGQRISEWLIQIKKLQYPTHYKSQHILELRKHIGKMAYQCNSYTTMYVGQSILYFHGLSADGWYNSCPEKGDLNYTDLSKPILKIPEVVGYMVHKSEHMGIYIGGGKVLEARGTWDGVVITNIADRGWLHWGRVLEVDYTEDNDMIKYKEKSANVGLWQHALNDAGFTLVVDNSFGPITRDQTNAFKDAIGLPKDDPCTVTLVEWTAMIDYRIRQCSGIPQAQYEQALAVIKTLSDKIDGYKVTIESRTEDLITLKQIEVQKAAIFSKY